MEGGEYHIVKSNAESNACEILASSKVPIAINREVLWISDKNTGNGIQNMQHSYAQNTYIYTVAR